jgi:aspartate racemase
MTALRPLRMKTIGVLGGMSQQATAEYYRLINQTVNDRLGGWDIAEIVIQSVNFGNIEHFVRNELWDEAAAYLRVKAQGAERAGADVLICVSNTLHRVADAIKASIGIPFIHIADPTGAAIRAAGLTQVALLGTRPVMSASFMRDRYRQQHGLAVITPNAQEQLRLDAIIFDELCRGVIRPASKAFYLAVCERLREQGAQGVILGCTEICLLINQQDMPHFPCFDTTSLHVAAVVQHALRE